MKEISNEIVNTMTSAVSSQAEQSFRPDFYSDRELPKNLEFLESLSWNYYWSWNFEAASLYRHLAPTLWEKYEQNPRKTLEKISGLRLWQMANDVEYVDKLNSVAEDFQRYMAEKPRNFGKVSAENPVAYFCAEYGVHNSLPNYSGGLGILAGDHLKSASDLNVPLVAVGLFYRFGYFRQKISHDGWQQEKYLDNFQSEIAVQPVTDEKGERVFVSVHIREREVFAQAWLAQIGRIKLYLLDTNLAQNAEVDRLITGHLYGGDAETRIVQEKVLGICGVRLLRKLNVEPSVYHLNEGHSAFLTLELAREFIAANETAEFVDAVRAVREKCVFTTHTPVAAGNDVFPPDKLKECFSDRYINSLKMTKEDFLKIGRTKPDDVNEWFGMTPLAIRMARSSNGVSEKHGEVSRELWLKMFPELKSAGEVPITFVTNGVHAPTWIAPVYKKLYEKHIGANWTEILRDQTAWEAAISQIPDADVWNAHSLVKQLLIAFIRQRVYSEETGSIDTINEREDTRKLFAPDVLTIGFARRVAAYKRWNLLMTDLPRLLKLVDDADRPVQFVFAGKAHPQDNTGKKILQNLMSINDNSNWQHRAVFIEDYDQEIARYLVQGVDVWLNVPRRPLEASGTSGEKAAMNGGLNFSILDGWWIEGYNEINGFAIGDLSKDESEAVADKRDAAAFYDVLESQVIPAYYEKGENNLPTEWVRRLKNALATLTPQFSSDRMLMDYVEKIYNQTSSK